VVADRGFVSEAEDTRLLARWYLYRTPARITVPESRPTRNTWIVRLDAADVQETAYPGNWRTIRAFGHAA
jgi:hypothetical protein